MSWNDRQIRLVRDVITDRPALDTAISRAILERVAAGELPETMRLARPGAMVAFGKQDVKAVGYPEAAAAARGQGFEAVRRLAGGRAAVFHEGTVAFAHAVADSMPSRGTHDRFREVAEMMVRALRGLGVDAHAGEIAGEYCPGEYSVNAGGRVKLAGIGQRIIKGGAHIGAVLVVSDADRVRDVLVPVYQALGLEWDPATVGGVDDEVPGITWDDVAAAILAEVETVPAELDAATLDLARSLEHDHLG
jgi:lipoate-protein ligase A